MGRYEFKFHKISEVSCYMQTSCQKQTAIKVTVFISYVDSLTFLCQGDMNKKSSKLDLNKISSHDVSFVGSTLNLAVEV